MLSSGVRSPASEAVEQLGSDRAAARHGGPYALERLAQDNPRHRQTVVNVLCAHLRAPCTPPPAHGDVHRIGLRRRARPDRARRPPAPPATPPVVPVVRTADLLRQEREVRVAAERVLAEHLRPGDEPDHDAFWPDIDLDLAGATLVALDLADCRLRAAGFRTATFAGDADFTGTAFAGDTRFDDVTFAGDSTFTDAAFAEAPDDLAAFLPPADRPS